MSPEEMMQVMMEFASPAAAESEHLAPLIGEFTSTTSYWMAPDAPPAESEGSAHAEWILGGRFVALHFNGDMMGMPFEGMGWIGYDKVREAYVNAWIDNFGAWMMDLAEGQASEDGKTITFVRRSDSPAGPMHLREVYRFEDENGYVLDMYLINPDGSELHTMRIENTRR